MSYNVAILGIETITGQEILNQLHERAFPVQSITVICEDKQKIKPISFGEDTLTMIHVDAFKAKDTDILFLTGTEFVAKSMIEKLATSETKIIDLTNTQGKILSVPDLGYTVSKDMNIVSSPSSSSIQLLTTLNAIEQLGKIESVVVSTYHATSEISREAMDELFNQVRTIYMNQEPKTQNFPKEIAFNAIPQVGSFEDNHSTSAEIAITSETATLLKSEPQIAATCVFVPTFVGHGQSVTVQFSDEVAVKDAKSAWRDADTIEIIDLESEMEYVTPSEVNGEKQVFLSRIRTNPAMKNSLSFWSVMDNLQNGQAYNAVRIAETILGVETPAETSNIDGE